MAMTRGHGGSDCLGFSTVGECVGGDEASNASCERSKAARAAVLLPLAVGLGGLSTYYFTEAARVRRNAVESSGLVPLRKAIVALGVRIDF